MSSSRLPFGLRPSQAIVVVVAIVVLVVSAAVLTSALDSPAREPKGSITGHADTTSSRTLARTDRNFIVGIDSQAQPHVLLQTAQRT